jgi:hypothetical protein
MNVKLVLRIRSSQKRNTYGKWDFRCTAYKCNVVSFICVFQGPIIVSFFTTFYEGYMIRRMMTIILVLLRAHMEMFRIAINKLFEWLFSGVLVSHRGGPG